MKPVTAVSRTGERPSKRSDVCYFDSICTTRTQKTNRPPFGKGKCRRFRRAVHRRAAFFYGRGRSLAGGAGAIRLWNGDGQVANMTRFTLIIRARRSCVPLPPSPSDPTLDRTVSLSIVSAILEREQSGSSIGEEGERGTKQRSLFVSLSVRSRPSVPPFPVARHRHHLSVLPALNQTLLSRPGMYTTRRALQPPPSALAPPASIV